MEENSNNFIIKGLAIILIAIIALNVYRTETTRKELAGLGEHVSQLAIRLDSLQISAAVLPVSTGRQTSSLERKVSVLEAKINSLQSTVDHIAKSSTQATSGNIISRQAQPQTGPTKSSATSNTGRVTVTAKVKVENRYVQGTTYIPKITSGPAGVVVINVTMDQLGIVNKVSLNSSSTIEDEDIIDQCKESALKTRFAYNPEAPDKSTGTITYTFPSR